MKLTIAKKLGLGFSVIIALMITSAAIAYFNLRTMNQDVVDVVDEAAPTLRACDRLLIAVNESLAALRGYLILGEDPQQAAVFRTGRAEAWKELDAALSDLEGHLADWNDSQQRPRIAGIDEVVQKIRDVQQAIEEVAHTDRNIESHQLLVMEATPHALEALDALTAMIDEEKTLEASAQRKGLLAAIADSRGTFAQGLANMRALVLSGDGTYQRAFEEQWRLNQQAHDKALSMAQLFTSAQQRQWDRYTKRRSEFEPLPARMFASRQAQDWNQAEYLLEQQAVPLARQLKQSLDSVTAAAEQRMQQSRVRMDAAGRSVTMALFLSTLAGIVVGGLVAVVLSRKIVATVRALAERAQEISEGNLSGAGVLARSGDELGQLADGFDTMLSGLKDLTSQILSVTENVNSAAAQISSSARQQASSTKEQAATVQEVTSTMQELSQSGAQIVEKAKEVAAAAESASQQTNSGIDSVRNTNQTMEAIREQVEEVAENIVALSEKTQAVSEIIATVNDIAEQSNLLALNATIEAAEAGDEGNRFAVVANEMKNLADQAKECTVQVRNILGEIQKGINSAVLLTEEAVKRVESGKQQADVSESTIRQMYDTTQASIQAFQQIIGATNQQQVGFEQVTRGMQDIDLATQQTASGTAQLDQAVASLSSMSQQLQTAVSSYRI